MESGLIHLQRMTRHGGEVLWRGHAVAFYFTPNNSLIGPSTASAQMA